MYIKKYMLERNKLTTLDLEDSLRVALDKINKGDFLSLPVLEGEDFKGILLKEKIFREYFDRASTDRDEFLDQVKVKDIYSDEFKSVMENDLVENASYLLKELRTPFLPVFDARDKFAGILTHVAIFNAFSDVFGMNEGTRIVVNMYDIPGQLARLAEVIRREKVNILNFAAVDAKVLDVYKVVLRVDTKTEEDLKHLIARIEEAGFKIGDIDK